MGIEIFSLEGKAALVTGASRGMGKAIAMTFAEAGADVVLAARSKDALDATAARIKAMGRKALAIACDVTNADDIRRCVEEAVAAFGAIDVLVNNAGGPMFNSPFLDIREQGWEKVLTLNLTSVMRFTQQVGAHMVERGRGSIINIGSPSTFRPWPAIAPYSAAKAAVLNLTQVLAQEWGEAGVRLNVVSPGWIDTEINRAFVASKASESIVSDVPMGRWGTSDDVVGVCVWLASNASSYVTGANIPVDGGLTVAVPEDWRSLRVARSWQEPG
jgi:NAD(P)-dependent dehydrogenase (short-subunit alcohol dehydrogenase family)